MTEYDVWMREEELHPTGAPENERYYPQVSFGVLKNGDILNLEVEGKYRTLNVKVQIIEVDHSEDFDSSECPNYNDDPKHWRDATHCYCDVEMTPQALEATWAERRRRKEEFDRKIAEYQASHSIVAGSCETRAISITSGLVWPK
jgi:hypothetical protein